MERIWGFDLGTTSIGFAVVEYDEATGRGKIVREGVRIFPEGRTEKELEPRNQARRAARLIRRQIRRRRLRRKLLRDALAEAGLLPHFASRGTPEWHAFMNDGTDPYELRARALREPLEPFQVGRALYHLAHRRGFLSARRAEDRPDEKKAREKEEGPVKKEIKSLQAKIAGRSLGEYLHTLGDEKKRGSHLAREWVMDEFERLWDTQAAYHPHLLTKELKERLRGILLYQRPTFWRLQTVGSCSLEPGEPACPAGCWLGQQFRMLQLVNNLRVRFPGELARPLDSGERDALLPKLQRQARMTFAGVRSALKPVWQQRGLSLKAQINLESDQEKELLGNEVEAKLAGVLGEAWDTHPCRERLRAELYPRLFAVYNRRVGNKRIELHRQDAFRDEITPARARFIAEAQRDFGITPEQAAALADYEPPAGWLRYSEKAIRRLLPRLEQGMGLNEAGGALDQAYPGRREQCDEILDRLPSHPRKMPALRNPSVHRALNELRKVVNNLLAVYGKPDLVRIELLRELKKTKKERLTITSRYNQNERNRKAASRDLHDNNIRATNPAIEKWLLWKESGEYCPYTGRKICFDDLFRTGEFQVEHIFPRSRSLDNNLLNKTLCATDVNTEKGERTPFEFFRSRPEEWVNIGDRLKGWVKKGKFPEEKMRNFLREDYPQGQEFLEERQRADSSYIAVEARKFLARLGVPVQVVNGQVTAQLRSRWGLDAILNPEARWRKNRADHRHHAVDALAVAFTSPAFVKRLSDFYARDRRGEKPKLPLPWETFWQDAKAATQPILVSHRVQRKVSGPLHAQTFYGDTRKEVTKSGITYRCFVFRKPLEKISASEIENIRDPEIRRLVTEHLEKRGGDPRKAFGEDNYPLLLNKKTGEVREIRRVRLLVKRQAKVMQSHRTALRSFVELDNLHHIAIYDKGDPLHETVTLFEAFRRARSRPPERLVRPTNQRGGKLLISLCPRDVLEIEKPDRCKEYFVVRKFNEKGRVFYMPIHQALDPKSMDPPQKEVSFGPERFLRPDIRKVNVDPIGRVRPAHD